MFLGKHLNERSFFMDKESISRLGLDYISNIDVESSDEIYDPSTTNHIIVLKLIKQSNVCYPHCGLVLNDPIIRSSMPLFWLTEKIKRKIINVCLPINKNRCFQ